MWTIPSVTLLLLSSLANNAICDLIPAKRASQPFDERSTFTGGNALAHITCTSTLTSCNWGSADVGAVGWCCPFSTVCDGTGGGAYCCPTSDDCGPSVDSVPRCADPSWSMWTGGGTGTHSIDGNTILPKYFCCLGTELGLMNDTCVKNTMFLSSGEQATLVAAGSASGSGTTSSAIKSTSVITSHAIITSTPVPSVTTSTSTEGGLLGDITSAIASATASHTGTSNAEMSRMITSFSIWGVLAGVFGLAFI